MNKDSAISKFRRQIDELDDLRSKKRFSPNYNKWHRNTGVLIQNTFGHNTRHIDDFKSIHYSLPIWTESTPDSVFDGAFLDGLDEAKSILESFIEEINEYWKDETVAQVGKPKATRAGNKKKKDNHIRTLSQFKCDDIWDSIHEDFDISKLGFGKKINFVKDTFVRKILFRDVEQAYILAKNGFSKPAVILAGSVIEELLRQYLKDNKINPPKDTFDEYIKTCRERGLLKSAIHSLTDSVRHFRNLVHIEKEKSAKYTISKATAKGAVASIFTIANDFENP